MSVASNIKRFREGAGLTQEELADKVGVARSTVTQWENGWSSPRMGMVQRLAGVFGTTTAEIVAERTQSNDSRFEELYRYYTQLDDAGRDALLATARGLAQAFGKNAGGGGAH